MFGILIFRFASTLAKRELLHLYTEEGMSISDFQHAREKIESLLLEYQSLEENDIGRLSYTSLGTIGSQFNDNTSIRL